MHKGERDVFEDMRKIDECGTEKFGTLDGSEKTIAILGDCLLYTSPSPRDS